MNPEQIGIIGICGWGGYGINTAAIDTRIKATAIITMYDMSRVTNNNYNDALDTEEARYAKRKALSDLKTTYPEINIKSGRLLNVSDKKVLQEFVGKQ